MTRNDAALNDKTCQPKTIEINHIDLKVRSKNGFVQKKQN